jgi:hypothetical protein
MEKSIDCFVESDDGTWITIAEGAIMLLFTAVVVGRSTRRDLPSHSSAKIASRDYLKGDTESTLPRRLLRIQQRHMVYNIKRFVKQ